MAVGRNWEAALHRGLLLAKTPYYESLGFTGNPFGTEVETDPDKLAGRKETLEQLLATLAREGSDGLGVVSLIALGGSGATSIVRSALSLIAKAKGSKKTGVARFALEFQPVMVSARDLLRTGEEEEGERSDSVLWLDKALAKKATHIVVDDCDALGRDSVFPFVSAVVERGGKPFVFLLCHSPSSYNRFVDQSIRTRNASDWLRGEVILPPASEDEVATAIARKVRERRDLFDAPSLKEIYTRTHGSFRDAFRLAKLCLEDLLERQRLPVTALHVRRVADRAGYVDMETSSHLLTDDQVATVETMVRMGDHVSAEELADELGVVRTAAVRMLLRIEARGWLLKYGAGTRVIYHLSPQAKMTLESRLILERLTGVSGDSR